MKKIDFKKQLLPHLFAVVIMLVASGLYFLPELQGKKIQSHDKLSYVGAAKEKIDFEKKGETIFWTSRVFGGMPLFQISYDRKSNLLKKFEIARDIVPYSMGKSFGLMLGFYIALLLLGVRWNIAASISVAFGFSTWFLLSIEAAHSSKVYSISYMAPLLASVVAAYRGKLLLGGVLTSVFLSLMISSNHPQIAYYSLFMLLAVAIIFLVLFFKEKKIVEFFKVSIVLLGFGTLGLLPNAGLILTSLDYSKESTRGGQSELTQSEQAESAGLNFGYAMRWSYGKMESFNLLIPGLYAGGYAPGENSNLVQSLTQKGVSKKQALDYAKGIPMYYGDQPFTTGPTYLGAVVLFFFILFFFLDKGMFKWGLLLAFILSLMFAWGENLEWWSRLFFENIPMFNKFRNPSMWLSIAIVTSFIGAGLAVKHLFERDFDTTKIQKQILISGGILGGVALLFLLFGTALIDSFEGKNDAMLAQNGFPVDAIVKDRIDLVKKDALRTLAFVLAIAAASWLWAMQKIKNANLWLAFVAVLLLLDLVPVGQRYLNKDDFSVVYGNEISIPPTKADQTILQDKALNYRVFNTTLSSFNDNSTSYFHQSVGGYSAVKLYRYQDLIDYHLGKGNMKVFNMLNTKYFIQGKPGEEVARQNPDALGSVWFVNNIKWAKNADEEMELMNEFDPKSEVVIDERFKSNIEKETYSANGEIKLSSFHPEKMIYNSNSSDAQFAVFSEIWYKGNKDWKAYIDGEETEFVRVNYLLRGLEIPAGNHEIVFEFNSKAHFTGSIVGYISSIVVLLLLVFLIYRFFTTQKASS